MKCESCGAKLKPGETECPYCGSHNEKARLPEKPQAPVNPAPYAPGTTVKTTTTTVVTSQGGPGTAPSPAPALNRKKQAVAGVITFVVVIIIAVIIGLSLGNGGSAKAEIIGEPVFNAVKNGRYYDCTVDMVLTNKSKKTADVKLTIDVKDASGATIATWEHTVHAIEPSQTVNPHVPGMLDESGGVPVRCVIRKVEATFA